MTDNMPATVSKAPLLDPLAAAELRALYKELDADVAELGPVCQLSGRCCRFKEYGHTLFISTPEAQLLLESAPEPCRPLDRGDTCPWQNEHGHCTARDSRPMGCRVYYCDPSYERFAYDLSERFIRRLKELTDNQGLAWNYAPLHRHLDQAQAPGSFRFDAAHGESQ
jgi:Fe-S-cluster containining protein